MATHARIFRYPLSPTEALNNIKMFLGFPHIQTLSEGEGFLQIYEEIAGAIPVRGNLVPDAHLVALLKQSEVKTLYSNDTDFRKFSWLTVKNPLI
jgi:predicted nucleic acid-binding protein